MHRAFKLMQNKNMQGTARQIFGEKEKSAPSLQRLPQYEIDFVERCFLSWQEM